MSTGISWTDEVWNPVHGCSKVSAGCVNCYAERLSHRFKHTEKPWTKPNAPENVTLHPERLEKPLRWRKPRRVFVNSMSDLFHEQVPDQFIAKVFGVMAEAAHHTFQVLTKRPERMAELLNARRFVNLVEHSGPEGQWICGGSLQWPLPNIWLGTSVENQKAADERIPHLLKTPATVRFLSCEPLLGPVDLTRVNFKDNGLDPYHWDYRCYWRDFLNGASYFGDQNGDVDVEIPRVAWVIAGGESGPGYRPMDLDWPRRLRDQCVDAGVPFFFKQSSGLRPETGASLDGEEWHQFPETIRSYA